MRIDFIINEMLKKVELASISIEIAELQNEMTKSLDNESRNRL